MMNNLPFSVENLDSDVVREAVINGYEPKKDDILNNPELMKYDWFIWLTFSYDPSTITILPSEKLSEMICDDALKRGYIPQKEDLLNNPELFKYKSIVEASLQNDPSLIVYIDKNTIISNDVLSFVINNYNITEDDLKNHPKIRSNSQLMTLLGDKYEMYSEDISNERKKKIVSSYLYNGKIDELINIPFLDSQFNSKMDIVKIIKFIDSFDILIVEEDIDEQEKYIRILDKIIDSIVNINYDENKRNFKYNNINSLDLYIKECFHKNIEIDEIVKSIYTYVNGSLKKREFISFDYILSEVTKLNKLFLYGKLNNELSKNFYNEILNDFENRYKSEYKRYLISTIKDRFKLSSKKKEAILIGRKIDKVSVIIKNKEFSKLNILENEFILQLKSLRNYIKSIKQIRKSNIMLTENDFCYFEDILLSTGYLYFDSVNKRIHNKKVSEIIVKKYNQFKMRYIDSIELNEKESRISILDKDKIEYNYNNYIIGDKKRFYDNLADLIISLDKDDMDKIFSNEYCNYRLTAQIIPFINLFDEFKTKDLINILIFYDKTIRKITDDNTMLKYKGFNLLLSNLSGFIKISNGFASVNRFTSVILGNNLLNELKGYESNNYLDLYLKTYNRFKGTIPRIHGKIGDYTYESSNYRDIDKLLIGYIQDGSCIRLGNGAGEDTLRGCMLNEDDDVILIKNQNNELVGRMLMFRRGNVVMIAPLVTKYYNKNEILTKEFIDDISFQIINEAESNDDNIDFVFVCNDEYKNIKYSDYNFIRDMRFTDKKFFPHSDLNEFAYVTGINKRILDDDFVNGTKQERFVKIYKNIKYTELTKHYYLSMRSEIRVDKSEEEINRIKALRIELETDNLLKQELKNSFFPFYRKDYKYVISGEDWYIAVKTDDTIEEVLVPTDDVRARIEFEQAKETLEKGYNL